VLPAAGKPPSAAVYMLVHAVQPSASHAVLAAAPCIWSWPWPAVRMLYILAAPAHLQLADRTDDWITQTLPLLQETNGPADSFLYGECIFTTPDNGSMALTNVRRQNALCCCCPAQMFLPILYVCPSGCLQSCSICVVAATYGSA
jgi:hypothetical protein